MAQFGGHPDGGEKAPHEVGAEDLRQPVAVVHMSGLEILFKAVFIGDLRFGFGGGRALSVDFKYAAFGHFTTSGAAALRTS